MSHKDNRDLRNTGDGGWFYAEHELFSVFAPLIEPLGVVVYMAMCRLIPLAAVDPERQVTERAVMEAACVSKGTANRKMAEIVALGMVTRSQTSSRRTPTYELVSLRKLSLVGIAELERRLGGPPRTTEKVGHPTDGAIEDGSETAQTASSQGDASKAASDVPSSVERAPAASGENGGPRWTTERPAVETTLLDLLVVQKTPSVVQKTASVVQNRGSLFKEEKEEEVNTPVVPSQARGRLLSIAASADDETGDGKSDGNDQRRSLRDDNQKGKSKKPSHEAKDKSKSLKTPHEADEDLQAAVAKVMRECGLSARRIAKVIEAAMRLEATKTDEPANWNQIAERMIVQYDQFLEKQELMAYKVLAPRFFGEMWNDNRKWPWDEKRMRERRRL